MCVATLSRPWWIYSSIKTRCKILLLAMAVGAGSFLQQQASNGDKWQDFLRNIQPSIDEAPIVQRKMLLNHVLQMFQRSNSCIPRIFVIEEQAFKSFPMICEFVNVGFYCSCIPFAPLRLYSSRAKPGCTNIVLTAIHFKPRHDKPEQPKGAHI